MLAAVTERLEMIESTTAVDDSACPQWDVNDALCKFCRQPGQLVCCDGCVASYHVPCARSMALERNGGAVPSGEWLCNECMGQRRTRVRRS